MSALDAASRLFEAALKDGGVRTHKIEDEDRNLFASKGAVSIGSRVYESRNRARLALRCSIEKINEMLADGRAKWV